MTNNTQKAIIEDNSAPSIFMTLLAIFCGITVIFLLGIC